MTTERQRYERVMSQLQDELGQRVLDAVTDDDVTGIKIGGDGKLMIKTHSTKWEFTGQIYDFTKRLRIMNIIAHDLDKTLKEDSPHLSGELPMTGSRVEGWVPPIGDGVLVIRRHSSRLIPLPEYVTKGIMTQRQMDLLLAYIKAKKNVFLAGAVDSGKTTLANALLAEIEGFEHFLFIEDTKELRFSGENATFLKSNPPAVTLQDLVLSALRFDYDRIIIGETRGVEILALIRALDMGRKGAITTIHAEDAKGVLRRLAQGCLMAKVPEQWSLIRQTVDVIVYIKMTPQGRKVTEIAEVEKDFADDIPVKLRYLTT